MKKKIAIALCGAFMLASLAFGTATITNTNNSQFHLWSAGSGVLTGTVSGGLIQGSHLYNMSYVTTLGPTFVLYRSGSSTGNILRTDYIAGTASTTSTLNVVDDIVVPPGGLYIDTNLTGTSGTIDLHFARPGWQ